MRIILAVLCVLNIWAITWPQLFRGAWLLNVAAAIVIAYTLYSTRTLP